MATFKNESEMYWGACPDDDGLYAINDIEDCVTFEEFDTFSNAALTEYLEELKDSTDSCDTDRAETIVNVLRKRGQDIKPNRIEDVFDNLKVEDYWVAKDELQEYYTKEEIDAYKNAIFRNAASWGLCLGRYLTEPATVADGTAIRKTQNELIKLSMQFDVVYEAWRELEVADEEERREQNG